MNDLEFDFIECMGLDPDKYITRIDLRKKGDGMIVIPMKDDVVFLYSEYHDKFMGFEVINRGFMTDKRRIMLILKEME